MTGRLTFAVSILVLFLFTGFAEALCVNTGHANVRTGPGRSYQIVWEVYRYMPFVKVGESISKDWYAVRDVDGDVNWIQKGLLTGRFGCAVVKKNGVNVRTGPGVRYAKSLVGPAKKYDSFRVLKKKRGWVKVKDEWGNTGWIVRTLLWIQ